MNPNLSYEAENIEEIKMMNVKLNLESLNELFYDESFEFRLLIKDNSAFGKEVYKNAVSLIRKRLNKKKVLKDCKEILLFLNENINTVIDVIKDAYF